MGKIHVSQATADELKKHGKGSWLIKKSEKIMVKGKGEQQTYLVVPFRASGSVISYSDSGGALSSDEHDILHPRSDLELSSENSDASGSGDTASKTTGSQGTDCDDAGRI